MEENEEIKKDREALKKYLEQGNNGDFIKFAEEFAKKAGIEHHKAFAKVVDDESNFKINYLDPTKNNSDLRTPARIKSNGVIEVSKEHFFKHSIKYHEWNYRNRILVIHEISAMDREILQKDMTKERVRECFDYADISLRRLKESEKILIEKGIINKKDILLPLIDFFKHNLIKRHWKKLGWLGIKQRINLLIK